MPRESLANAVANRIKLFGVPDVWTVHPTTPSEVNIELLDYLLKKEQEKK